MRHVITWSPKISEIIGDLDSYRLDPTGHGQLCHNLSYDVSQWNPRRDLCMPHREGQPAQRDQHAVRALDVLSG
jgi:hypothetical protein